MHIAQAQTGERLPKAIRFQTGWLRAKDLKFVPCNRKILAENKAKADHDSMPQRTQQQEIQAYCQKMTRQQLLPLPGALPNRVPEPT